MTPSLYTFTDYSPGWPVEFQREADRLKGLLGDELAIVHHIGSTSVPGLAGKSVIDLLPLVRDISHIDDHTAMLEEAGYKAWGEYGLPGRRYFTRDQGEIRTHNLHIFRVGDPDVDRHLAFCAYLRVHEGARREYEALKRGLFARHAPHMAAYNDGKDAWIKQTERVALEWYRREGG
jgi:GrpB-like predicted nucleotidyltransferase (UPF0157 family)